MGKTRLIGFCIALVGIAASQSAWPVSLVEIDAARVKGLAYLFKAQKGDGSWFTHDSLKVQTTATALEALTNAGIRSGKTYGAAGAWLANTETASIDSTARKIAALAGTGMNMKPHAQALLAFRTLSDRQVWGAYPQYGMSFPDTPLAIAAIRSSGYSYAGQANEVGNAVACEILPSQRAGGGWSYTRAATLEPTGIGSSALMPSAITLLEIATLKTINGWASISCSGGSSYNLSTILNSGVAYLLTKQNADNGFGENGVSTPLQTALAYLAIQAVNAGHPAIPLAQDYLLTGAGQQSPDGSWSGDPLATALVLKTFPTLSTNALIDGDQDGVPDVIEVALNNGTSPTQADGKSTLATSNGLTIIGFNSPIFIEHIQYLRPMAPLQLNPAGAGPYAITAGSLPPGITMDGNGILSGIPTQIGVFNFSYGVMGKTNEATIAQLNVIESENLFISILPAILNLLLD
jgi:hypothetical protein